MALSANRGLAGGAMRYKTMNEYQQQQSGWEWRQFDDERWHAENVAIDIQLSKAELAKAQPITDQLLTQFDSVFGQSEENINE